MIGYGAPFILFKLDNRCEQGILVQRKNLGSCKGLDLLNFSDVMLATLFVAAGCDYCDSLSGIGIVTAHLIVKESFHGSESRVYDTSLDSSASTCSSISISKPDMPVLCKIFRRLFSIARGNKLSDKDKRQYEEKFMAALLMYRHAIVYDPVQGKCLFMNNPSDHSDTELMDYQPYAQLCSDKDKLSSLLGEIYLPEKTALITKGWVNPRMGALYEQDNIPSEIEKMFKKHYLDQNDEYQKCTSQESGENCTNDEQISGVSHPSPAKGQHEILELSNSQKQIEILSQTVLTQSTGQSSSSQSKPGTQGSSSHGSSDLLSSELSQDLLVSPKRN